MKRVKLGDVFEISTSKGKAYLHYIYQDKDLIELIRVLPGLYSSVPENLDQIVESNEKFMVSFPLTAAYKRHLVEKVGHYPATNFTRPQYMRTEFIVGREMKGWHIVNVDTLQRQSVQKLTPEQMRLSPWGIWNDTFLIENLEKDWNLDKWI